MNRQRGGRAGWRGGPGGDPDVGPTGGHGGGPRVAWRRGRHGGFGGPFGGPGFGPPFGPPFGPGGHRWGHRGGRRNRGDVRTAVLALLREEPMHGYQIIQEIGERSGGSWRPSPGSVYPTLSQLADEGLVRAEKSEGRQVVHLTEAGRQWADEHGEELDAVWRNLGDESEQQEHLQELRSVTEQVVAAVGQVSRAGTVAQVEAATAALTEARRRIYRILADDETGEPAS